MPTSRRTQPMRRSFVPLLAALAVAALAPRVNAACCYFSAKNADILQPAQKVFLTFDPREKVETFTVQPKFEGNALDFGMVIPTPTQPKLHEMPKDFFKHLAIYSILTRREFPHSRLLPVPREEVAKSLPKSAPPSPPEDKSPPRVVPPPVRIVEVGVVGSLDYKILEADRADALYEWLKTNKYHFAGDEATLDFYVRQKWYFTVMKIDTA